MKSFAFIESNTTGTGQLFVRRAQDRGFRVVFLTKDSSRYPFLNEHMVQALPAETSQVEDCILKLNTVRELAGVYSSSDYFVECAAATATHFGLPSNKPEDIANCRNKRKQIQRLSAAGISVPKTYAVSHIDEFQQYSADLVFPVIVKPVVSSGSIGVRLCNSVEACREHIADWLSVKTNERGQAVDPSVLIQEYVTGDEFSVETFGDGDTTNVVGITRKHKGQEPHFLEIGHDFPAQLTAQAETLIEDLTVSALEKLGIRFGPAHTEVRLSDRGPVLMEVNARLGGGMIPVLVERAYGIDLIDATIALYSENLPRLERQRDKGASIRFFVPSVSGQIVDLKLPKTRLAKHSSDAEAVFTREAGHAVELRGDFRDRIGHVLTVAETSIESGSDADSILARMNAKIEETGGQCSESIANTGRITRTLSPDVLDIVHPPSTDSQEILSELRLLSQIDEAHLLMMLRQQLLDATTVATLLTEIRRLNAEDFQTIRKCRITRGVYLHYEDELSRRLGHSIGGTLQFARSRNDINATLVLLKLRKWFSMACRDLWALRAALLWRAETSLDVFLPIYSQYQAALPGTLSHYCLAVERALARDQQFLETCRDTLIQCPLGAGAGGGTECPVDPAETARLLGFACSMTNSLDAVASRDASLHFLCSLSSCSTTFSRIVQDFQVWTMCETAFVEFPDELSGGSSALPQKKNPYLLELIKCRSAGLIGDLASALASAHKSPFSNTMEVGTGSVGFLAKSVRNFSESAQMLKAIVAGFKFKQHRAKQAGLDGVVIATRVANDLVAQRGISFREAHYEVGEMIRLAIDSGNNPHEQIVPLCSQPSIRDNILEAAHSMEYGGGPGRQSSIYSLGVAREELETSAAMVMSLEEDWQRADQLRSRLVQRLLQSVSKLEK